MAQKTQSRNSRNAKGLRVPKRSGSLKTAARQSLEAYDSITAKVYDSTVGLPSHYLHELLEKKNPDPKELIRAAETSRSIEELARLHKWATGHRNNPLREAVEKRAKQLGFRHSQLTDAHPRKWNGKKNPKDGADRLYEKFHGKPASGQVVVEEKVHEHGSLATLGILISMRFESLTGFECEWGTPQKEAERSDFDETSARPDTIYLAASEDGRQLYFVGGEQKLDLKKFGMDSGEWMKDDMLIGPLLEITYRTRKKFDNFNLVDYYHQLGEDSGELPYLRYDPNTPHLYVSGGQYKIKMPLIGMSPGIEN